MGKQSDFGKRLSLKRAIILPGVFFLSLMLLTGCGTLETIVNKDGGKTPLGEWVGKAGSSVTVPASAGLQDVRIVTLYFPDSSGKYLLKEEREISKTLSVARETVKQWLHGPSVKGTMQPAVSPATALLDIAIKDGVVTVDLSKEFSQPYGKVTQEAAVYALVNTLTQFSTIKEVKFRIEGKPVTKLGNVDLSNLTYKESLVKGTGKLPAQTSPNSAAKGSQGNFSSSTGSNEVMPDSPSSLNLFSYPSDPT